MDITLNLPIRCERCAQEFQLAVPQLIHLGRQPELRKRLIQETIWQQPCPKCGMWVMAPAPLAVWDAANRRLIMYVPQQFAGQEGAVLQAKQLGEALTESLPTDERSAIRESVLVTNFGEYVDLMLDGFLDRLAEVGVRAEGVWEQIYQRLKSQDRRELLSLLHDCGGDNNPTFLKALSENDRLAAAMRRALDPDQKLYTTELEELIREVTYPDVVPSVDRRVASAAHVMRMCAGNDELRSIVGRMLTAINEGLEKATAADAGAAERLLNVALKELDFDAHRAERAILQHNLGTFLSRRAGGHDTKAREQAIGLYTQAIVALGEDLLPDLAGEAYMNLSRILLTREVGDVQENQESACQHLQNALACFEDAGLVPQQFEIHRLLAKFYQHRQTGDPADNVDLAIAHLKAALELPPGSCSTLNEWRSSLEDLARLYMFRDRGQPCVNRDLAIDLLDIALDDRFHVDHPGELLTLHLNIANALLERPSVPGHK